MYPSTDTSSATVTGYGAAIFLYPTFSNHPGMRTKGTVNVDPKPEYERNNMLSAMKFSSTVRLSAGT